MVSQTDVLKFTIELPASTSSEVLEWFEFIHAYGNLSTEIVNLVQNYINNNKYDTPLDFSPPNLNTSMIADQDDLLNSLYNYDGAASAIFCEERKVKKKMLSV